MWIGWQAPSLGRAVLLLAITQNYKHGDYELCCPFYGAQYLMDLLHECPQPPLEFIAHKTLIQNTSCLVAGVKMCWKEINTWAII